VLEKPRVHSLEYLRQNRGGGIVVEVNAPCHLLYSTFSLAALEDRKGNCKTALSGACVDR
jgi:hypothetical protein